MVKRKEAAGIKREIENNSFRATGITTYLNAGGSLEDACIMAIIQMRLLLNFIIGRMRLRKWPSNLIAVYFGQIVGQIKNIVGSRLVTKQ